MFFKSKIATNIFNLEKDITRLCKIANRDENSVKILAVSKTINEKNILKAIESGQNDFGENKLQEAKIKWPNIKAVYPNVKLHMIGALQSNKVKDALSLFDVIETIDREKIVLEILKYKNYMNIMPKLYVQINIGEEPQKNGCLPHKSLDFIKECKAKGLDINGVMGIAPHNEPPAPYFALLKNIADKFSLKNISMGMSNDYEDAIYLGSTCIRIGSKIFGERN